MSQKFKSNKSEMFKLISGYTCPRTKPRFTNTDTYSSDPIILLSNQDTSYINISELKLLGAKFRRQEEVRNLPGLPSKHMVINFSIRYYLGSRAWLCPLHLVKLHSVLRKMSQKIKFGPKFDQNFCLLYIS